MALVGRKQTIRKIHLKMFQIEIPENKVRKNPTKFLIKYVHGAESLLRS
jgi:hypothetical protein